MTAIPDPSDTAAVDAWAEWTSAQHDMATTASQSAGDAAAAATAEYGSSDYADYLASEDAIDGEYAVDEGAAAVVVESAAADVDVDLADVSYDSYE